MQINQDPVYIEDYPDGYPLTYPETGNQDGNQASVEWDIRTRNNQIGKVRQLGQSESAPILVCGIIPRDGLFSIIYKSPGTNIRLTFYFHPVQGRIQDSP